MVSGFKRTQFKDALRNIRKQRVSYISIIVIAFLGVTTFLGVDYSSFALKKNGSDMYNACNYRDIELMSTLLFSPQDMEAVREIEGVADAEEVWQLKVKVTSETRKQDANVISVTERINRPDLVEGRFPVDPGECAVEKRLADDMGWKVGEKITLQDSGVDLLQVVKRNKYEITGIVNHPDHICLNVPDIPYLMVHSSAFKMQRLENSFMKAEIVVDKPAGIDRFSEEYDAIVDKVRERLEALAPIREPIRTEEVREKISSAEPCKWYIFDRHGNASYVQLTIGSGNLAKLEKTFSLLFVIVGALVIYASITKMVDEQREQVGACKAFGLRNGEVLSKYMLYGVSATALGMAAGVAAARFMMEGFVLGSYNIYYTFDVTPPAIPLLPTVAVLAAGILLAVLATLVSCGMLMRSTAITLMRPKVPDGRKKPKKRRHKYLSLYFRLIVRNILKDWKRVTVTIVCVAGCCALVVIGFTLRFAVEGSLKKQYTTIVDYDAVIRFDSEASETAETDIAAQLGAAGCSYTALYDTGISYRVTDIQAAELLCGDIAEISELYHLRDRNTGEPISPTDDGILIQRRIAEIYGLDKGSEFDIAIGGTKVATVRVAGVYENYIGRYMILSPAYFEALYGETSVNNAFFVKLNSADGKALEQTLGTVEGYDSSTPSDKDREMFEAATSVMNVVVALFIFMAAVMAGVVLLNLTNTYILQKKTELTIMRINGFTVGEVKGYVLRETVITTVLGIALGIAFGSYISYRMIRSMEQPFVQFERGLSPKAWLLGTVITVFFAVVINTAALHKVKRLNLTDVSES